MRTVLEGGWIVGFDGVQHELLPGGAVVYEDDRIIHVGHGFEGRVDRWIDATGKLVSPGLINCHIHARLNAQHALLTDRTRSDYFGQNFLSYAAALRGARDAYVPNVEVDGKFGVWAAVRGGATTVLDIGTWPREIDAFARMVGELGVRAYLGPGFRSATYVFGASGRIERDWDEAAAFAGLESAKQFIERSHGSHNDRIRGMLYPGQLDTCTPELLTATKRLAAELGVGIQLHAAMNLAEFHEVVRERRETPIEYLERIGFLGPEVTLGHCLFHAGHSWAHYPYVDDLEILARSGASVAHAPYKYAKMGLLLESFDGYRQRGINVALGTDSFPEDLIEEMRIAALASRIAEGGFAAGTPRDVYEAATLGGAKALGRDDVGRLAPGAKADLIVVDLQQIHVGGVRDPIASLVDCTTGRDLEMVVIDGQTLIEGGRATRFDEPRLLSAVQKASEEYWSSLPALRGHTADQIAPFSYPVRLSDDASSGGQRRHHG